MLRRHLISLLAILALTGSSPAQSVDLSEGPLVDNFFRVDLAMKLTGQTKVQQDGKFLDQTVNAEAQHEFLEKIIHVDDGIVDKTVRTYRRAQANIKFGNAQTTRTFRPERTLLVTQRVQGQNITYCPQGSLTREELELTEHFNTLALTGLLPGKDVKIGDSWVVSKAVAQTLCGLEGLVTYDLTCKLEEIKDNVAAVRVVGSVNGIDLGVEVKISVQANYQFDILRKRLTYLNWKQSDVRDQGPACPALVADVEITLRRGSVEQPPELGSVVLGGMLPQTKEPPPEMTLVSYADPFRRFSLQYAREWIMTAQSREHMVWRLMNRGDLVAQVTVTPWTKLDAGKMMPFDEFVSLIGQTRAWKEERVAEKNDKLQIEGNRAYKYSASGRLDGSDVVQYFYLLASPQGDQLFVSFTLSPNQVKALNFRNEAFVHAITFPALEGSR
jgi:hypothetical protein